jgi:hypothetical protein
LKSSKYELKTPPGAGTEFRDTADSRVSSAMTGFRSLFLGLAFKTLEALISGLEGFVPKLIQSETRAGVLRQRRYHAKLSVMGNRSESVWKRGGAGEPYCSEKCWQAGGRLVGQLGALGRPCGFCLTVFTDVAQRSVRIPHEGKILCVCLNCIPKLQEYLKTYRKCCECQKEMSDGDTSPQYPLEEAALKCRVCSKAVNDYRYSFEDLRYGKTLGCQCSVCGDVLCVEHSVELQKARISDIRCSQCGATGQEAIVFLLEGPASSSMVVSATREGRYNNHIRPPGSGRRVVRS